MDVALVEMLWQRGKGLGATLSSSMCLQRVKRQRAMYKGPMDKAKGRVGLSVGGGGEGWGEIGDNCSWTIKKQGKSKLPGTGSASPLSNRFLRYPSLKDCELFLI